MEAAQTLLSQKLKESDELHLLDKAKLEEDMQKEKIKQEERLREELEKLKKNKEDIEKNLKGKLINRLKNFLGIKNLSSF